MDKPNRTVLFAAVGMSPAILTETAWALAQENPSIIPDEVVALTTLRGAANIRRILIESGGWDQLRNRLGAQHALCFGAVASIQIIGNGIDDFEDLTTAEENKQAADFILRALRQYTEDPSIRIIVSIAGGRKTMSALLLSCMNLLGREQDRVCHVLANDEYIRKHPEFLFPCTKREERSANVQLADIPFIRVRGIYEQVTGEAPASYSNMVAQFRSALPPAVVELPVSFYKESGDLCIGDTVISLSDNEFRATTAFVQDRRAGGFRSIDELAGEVFPAEVSMSDEFRRYLSNVRKKIRDAGFSDLCGRLLPPAKARHFSYRQIRFRTGRPRTSG